MTIAEQIEIAKDLIKQCEKRADYLSPDSHHGQASIHVNGEHWDGLKAILATLESLPAMLAVIEAARELESWMGHAEDCLGAPADAAWTKVWQCHQELQAALPPAPEETT